MSDDLIAGYDEADVTVVSGKGQVLIPQSIRERQDWTG